MKRDNIIFDIIEKEHQRQLKGIELIASEKESVVVKIFEVEKIVKKNDKRCRNSRGRFCKVGSIETDGKKYIKVSVPGGFVSILSLQLPGKKRLKIDELLRGYHLEDGCKMK